MTTWIIAALLLFFVQSTLPASLRYGRGSPVTLLGLFGNRDAPPDGGVLAARADRALRNSLEGMLLFLPLALLAPDTPQAVLGAQIFVLARLAYIPAYLSGVPYLRSAIWVVGLLGLVQIGMQIDL